MYSAETNMNWLTFFMAASQGVLGFAELDGNSLPVSIDIIELGWFSWQLASNILSEENVLKSFGSRVLNEFLDMNFFWWISSNVVRLLNT